jgi:hypothetical protein
MMTIVFALGLLLQDEKGDEFWKFEVGSCWEYTENQGGTTVKSVVKAKELKDDKLTLESCREVEGQEPQPKKMMTYVSEGYVVWAEEAEDGTMREYLRIYKLGSKDGDRWTSRMGEEAPEITIHRVGTEEITVGAGTYKDAVHLRFEMPADENGQSLSGDYWLVPNVGLVKMQMKQQDQEVYSMELTKFETKCSDRDDAEDKPLEENQPPK